MNETRIHKDYKITIPNEIIDTLDINLDDKLIWEINENEINIKVKKEKKLKNKTLSFVADEEIDSIKI